MRIDAFDYTLPPERIAQTPLEPRDSARLLDTRDLSDHRFAELPELLAPGDLVVVNTTRVRRARLVGRRAGGGKAEALLLDHGSTGWEALVRPARRIRKGTSLDFGEIRATVLSEPRDGVVSLRLEADGDIEEAIERAGDVPLPPYLHEGISDPERYQTMFAKQLGSAAAPTAALHFTPQVVERLTDAGIGLAEVELEVGLDTFRPITSDDLAGHEMHSERVRVPAETVAQITRCHGRGGRVVAIGTTVVRSLEAATADGELAPFDGATDLFITPGHAWRVVDLLVTNFHVPRSSLVVLIAAFMGDQWREAYATALERGYRFLSFGDAMLAARHPS